MKEAESDSPIFPRIPETDIIGSEFI